MGTRTGALYRKVQRRGGSITMYSSSRKSLRKQQKIVASMVVMILFVAACGSSEDDASTATTAPPPTPTTTVSAVTTQPPPTTTATAPLFNVDEALAVSDAYIEAFNTGDADAMLATLTPDVAMSEKYSDPSDFGNGDPLESIDRAFFEQHMVWSTAQGSTFTTPDCAVTEQGAAGEVTVVCEFGWLNAPEKAAGATPVPTVLTMVVTPAGISQLAFEYAPEFGVTSFDRWVLNNHSNDSKGIEYGDWDSAADAEQGGKLRAQYVAEWVASLEAND